ncbi:hypothetical protein MKX03_021455 [Papaver bracteatum]|nr:hypothetical protein MKX03_021455 [Papaver bracteatum]
MAGDGDLKIWVSDKLMSIVNFSQATVIQYVIGLAKQASSASDLNTKLVEFANLPSTTETRKFAQELFARAPRKSSGLNSYQREEKEAAMSVRKQQTYTLLEPDSDEEDIGFQKLPSPKKVDSHKKSFRKKIENQDDDEVMAEPVKDKRAKRKASYDEDDLEEERKQLEKNLRERDAAGTRKLTEQKLPRREEEGAIRRSKAMEKDDTEALRVVSRQEYLKKREQKKLEEIRYKRYNST